MTTEEKVTLLKPLGYRVVYDEVWGGEVGVDRAPREQREHVKSVFVPLTAEEWIATCMREGEHYIGPCCGNTGQMQDITNGAFRDDGWFDDGELLQLGVNGRNHEGLDGFNDDADVADLVSRWHELDPWEKIGLAYQATKERLHWSKFDRPNLTKYPLEDETRQKIRVLADSLSRLSLSDLFSDNDERREGQRHANDMVLKARMLEPALFLADYLKESIDEFNGYGIVNNETNEVINNRSGYCIYNTKEDAEYMLELFTRWERVEREEKDDTEPEHLQEQKIGDKVHIAPVRVTVHNGITVGAS